ncbi:MAG: hypothetical protein ABJ308_15600 [Halieaceae bacterium]
MCGQRRLLSVSPGQCLALLLLLTLGSVTTVWGAGELDVRVKAFGTYNELPDSDLQGEETGSPAWDGNLDLRLLYRRSLSNWQLQVDHTTVALAGDSFEFNQSRRGAIDQTPTDDDRRALELTWTLEQGDEQRLYHRFDRLAVQYKAQDWRLTLGRQAVSWGSGKVFNPMDLFAPFAPTTVDREYKSGEDLALFDQLLDNGGDLQLLAVFRRDGEGKRDLDEDSFAAKWRSFLGDRELELAVGRHYQDDVLALSYRQPLGGALLQTDWVGTHLDEEDSWKLSAVINVDYSFELAARSTYVFAEYFHNGFGRNQSPLELTDLPDYLVQRLQRGEVFNFMKDYLAVGGSYQWHPLLVQNLTLLWNLHDDSSLLQSSIGYEPGDQQRLEAGFTTTVGSRGDEYGRINVGEGFTTGGGSRIFVSWLYFW